MVLTDAQLDRVTGGPLILQVPHSAVVVAPSAVEGSIKVKTELGKILIGLTLPNGKELPAVQRK